MFLVVHLDSIVLRKGINSLKTYIMSGSIILSLWIT